AAWEGWLLRLRWLLDGAPETWRGLDPETTAIPPEFGIRQEKASAGLVPARVLSGKARTAREAPKWLTSVGLRSWNDAVFLGVAAVLAVLLGYGLQLLYARLTAAVGALPTLWIFVSAGLTCLAVGAGYHVATTGPSKSR